MSNLKFIKKLAYWDRGINFSNLLKLSANETKPPWVAKFISDKKDFYQEGNLFVGIGFYNKFTPMAFDIANGRSRYSIAKGYLELKKLNSNDYNVTLSGSTPENFVDTSNGFCYSIIKIPETSIKIEKNLNLKLNKLNLKFNKLNPNKLNLKFNKLNSLSNLRLNLGHKVLEIELHQPLMN